MSARTLQSVVPSIATSDGAGVKLRRSIGSRQGAWLDPFLMLDEFFSDNPNDYLAGFPNHPHRGFETVTYMLDGHMLHQDHLGNRGDLTQGSVQWMTAGRGIIHSEMPQQTAGRMRGFQLWINLPSNEKMKPASYRDISPKEIPEATAGGGRVKVIAGSLDVEGNRVDGPIRGLSTDPTYLDVALPLGAKFDQPIASDYTVFVYPYEGSIKIGDSVLPKQSAGILSSGDRITITAASDDTRFILLAGKPLKEPIVQYGPFVMNTRAEIEQAVRDFQSGALTRY